MRAIVLGLAASLAAGGALAQTTPTAAFDTGVCPVADDAYVGRAPLDRARAAVAGGRLKILAIGSSSIEGAGASSPDRAFVPSLKRDLETRLPGVSVTVVNRGIGGETAEGASRRMAREIEASKPDLILWQLGTNDVLQDRSEDQFVTDFRRGLDAAEASGADVVLIDPQRLPDATTNAAFRGRNPTLEARARLIALEADRRGHGVSHRFSAMSGWSRVPRGGVGPDDLHLNDAGYACWSQLTAAGLAPALR